jgi:hypothetical protein
MTSTVANREVNENIRLFYLRNMLFHNHASYYLALVGFWTLSIAYSSPTRLGFPEQTRFCECPAKFGSGCQISQVFTSHKNTFLTNAYEDFLLSHSGKKKHLLTRHSHQPPSNREKQENERKMFRLLIIKSGLRLRKLRNGYVK